MSQPLKKQIKEFLTLGYTPYFNMAVVFALAILGFIWYNWISPEDCYRNDTPDYYETWWSYFTTKYREIRTPVYPIFIGPITDWLGIDDGKVVLLVLQKLLRFVSCFYLWKICKFMGLKDRYNFWLITMWLLLPYPCRYDFDSKIHTESLAVTFYIFMCWSAILTMSRPRCKWLVACAFWAFLLVFLRPANLILIPLLALLFVALRLIHQFNNKLMWYGLLSVAIIGRSAYGFQKYTANKYGNGLFTNVSDYNNYCLLMEADILYPEYFDDEEVRELCKIYLRTGDKKDRSKFHDTLFDHDFPAFVMARDYVGRVVRTHPDEVVMAIKNRFPVCMNDPVVFSADMWENHPRVHRYLPRVWMGAAMLLIYLCMSIRIFKRSPQRGLIGMWFCVMGLVTYLMTYLGAMSDWGRLNLAVFFIVMLGGFLMLQDIATWIKRRAKERLRAPWRGNGD